MTSLTHTHAVSTKRVVKLLIRLRGGGGSQGFGSQLSREAKRYKLGHNFTIANNLQSCRDKAETFNAFVGSDFMKKDS